MKIDKIRNVLNYDEDKAVEIFRILANAMAQKEGIFKDLTFPQDLYPVQGDSRTVIHWLMYLSLPQRGPVRSEELTWPLYRLFLKQPELFDPRTVVENFKEEYLASIFSKTALKYKDEEIARFWMHNSRLVVERWDGNFENAFIDTTSFEEFYTSIDWKQQPKGRGIRGMRRKLASMMLIFLQRRELAPKYATPPPVDFHLLRELIATGVIKPDFRKFEGLKNKERQRFLVGLHALRLSEYAIEELHVMMVRTLEKHPEIPHDLVNHGSWAQGRELCGRHHQTKSIRVRDGLTPEEIRSRRTVPIRLITPSELLADVDGNPDLFKLTSGPNGNGKKNPVHWPKNYFDPCQYCHLENHCTKVVPSGPYYDDGLLIPLKRVQYPHSRSKNEGHKELSHRTGVAAFKTIAQASKVRNMLNPNEQKSLFDLLEDEPPTD